MRRIGGPQLTSLRGPAPSGGPESPRADRRRLLYSPGDANDLIAEAQTGAVFEPDGLILSVYSSRSIRVRDLLESLSCALVSTLRTA